MWHALSIKKIILLCMHREKQQAHLFGVQRAAKKRAPLRRTALMRSRRGRQLPVKAQIWYIPALCQKSCNSMVCRVLVRQMRSQASLDDSWVAVQQNSVWSGALKDFQLALGDEWCTAVQRRACGALWKLPYWGRSVAASPERERLDWPPELKDLGTWTKTFGRRRDAYAQD